MPPAGSQALHFDRLSASLVNGETRPYVRVGSSNRGAQDEEIRRLYVEGSEGGFEPLPCRGATKGDLWEALVVAYVRRREETSGQPLGLSWEEALRGLGCIVEQGEKWVPTNAGVMLFTQDPQRFIGQAEVTCVRFKGADVVSYVDRRDLRGPLYQLVDDAEQFIYRHMKVGSEFRVTLVGPGERFMEEVTVRPAWAKGLSERQVEAVLHVGEHGRITTAEYRDLVGISDVTAYRDLKDLCEKGLLVRHGKGRGTYYTLVE